MDFNTLNEMIPYVYGGKKHLLEYKPYNGVTLRLPGRHQDDTDPRGGDFVVCVDDDGLDWIEHQFTHVDIFNDLQRKLEDGPNATLLLLEGYSEVIKGAAPEKLDDELVPPFLNGLGIHPQTFLYAAQCLAVAEHRRYHKFEKKFGGRYLPFRFAAGIVEGNWTAKDATARHRMGRPGVEWLEKEFGTPQLTKELFNV